MHRYIELKRSIVIYVSCFANCRCEHRRRLLEINEISSPVSFPFPFFPFLPLLRFCSPFHPFLSPNSARILGRAVCCISGPEQSPAAKRFYVHFDAEAMHLFSLE